MEISRKDFLKCLNKEPIEKTPLYCTGYPEKMFIDNYKKLYKINIDDRSSLFLNNEDYSLIKKIGFNAISLWDYRRGKGGYIINNKNNLRVDGWGRVFKENWYRNDGVFKNLEILKNWEHLSLPPNEKLHELKQFIPKCKKLLDIEPVLSLPGLFEKTWQSMGLIYFAKCLRNNQNLVNEIISFFSQYLKNLILILQKVGAKVFIIADDCAYKNREFIRNELWSQLFLSKYIEITEHIHKSKHKIIIHSDGNISKIIELFIEAGFDAIQSLEPSAGVDIFNLFKKYKNKICFIGNLDISDLIFKRPEDIRFYVKKLFLKAREYNSSLIISPTQQINSKVKPENLKTMIETTKSLNTYY